MQKLFTFIIAGIILYTLFQQNVAQLIIPEGLKTPQQPDQSRPDKLEEMPITGTFLEKTLSSVMINVLKTEEGRLFMESMIQPMNKTIAGSGAGFGVNNDNFLKSMFKINSFGEGEKGPASCGHIVTIHYKILNGNNIVLQDNVATYPLGSEKIAPGLDAVIVGMKTGETRNATISSKYFQETANNKISIFKVSVLLKEIMPQNFIDDTVKIFDDELAYRVPLMCGNKAIYDTKITRLSNGEVIYDSKLSGNQISMRIGNLNYPMIFSHALHNKIPVGTRTVIAKGRYFKSYASDYSIIFPDSKLPEEEYFMAEFYNFHDKLLTKPATFPHNKSVKPQEGDIRPGDLQDKLKAR